MATRRSDIIIPEIFTGYVEEQTTNQDKFLQSGVVAPLAALNASEDGGDFVNIPNIKANLSGDFEVMSDSTSLTPGKITADKQIGVVLHRARAFETRDLATLAAGTDLQAAIGNKLGAYIAHQKQKDLISCLQGAFGSLNANTSSSALFNLCLDSESGDSPAVLSSRTVSRARALLGDQGDKLSVIAMHSNTYYDLEERNALRYIDTSDVRGTTTTQSGGDMTNTFGNPVVAEYMGMRVVVSDDIPTTGSGASTEYGVFMFTPGAVGTGEQSALRTETDRDILAKSSAVSFDLHYLYHPIGIKWAVTTTNPNRTQLETASNWSLVYETKNVGIVRATVVSNHD